MEAPVSMSRPSPMTLRNHRSRPSSNKPRPSSALTSDHTNLTHTVDQDEESEEEDDGDDGSDQPAVNAPSYGRANLRSRKAGHHKRNLKIQTAFPTEIGEMFANTDDSNENLSQGAEQFDIASSEDDDDEIYRAVDDISDDEDAVEMHDEQLLMDEFAQEPINFLDGLSDIGNDEDFALGAVFDDFSSHSSSENSTTGPSQTAESSNRRVSFEDDHQPDSPITALTTLKAPASSSSKASCEDSPLHPTTFHEDGSDYDSEMTDEDLPSEVNGTPDILHVPPVRRSNSDALTRPAAGRKGPRCGWFDIDPKQSWSILHPSGKKMLIMPRTDTGRHDWLDNKLRSASVLTSASSAPSSTPLIEGSPPNVPSNQRVPDFNIETEMVTGTVNPIMAALNRAEGSNDMHGHATGPPEAFAPLPIFQDAADFHFDADGGNGQFVNDDDDPEDDLLMANFIKYDDEESSDDGDAESRPSTAMPPPKTPTFSHSRSNSAFAHLNNLNSENVMAFRRNTEGLQTSPIAFSDSSPFTPGHGLMRDAFHSPKTALPASTRAHKRKASNEPYSSSHYDGVTPVERKILNTSSQSLKKRKLTV